MLSAIIKLSQSMDAHNVGRGRGSVGSLEKIRAKTLVIGIESDILFPVIEQQFMPNIFQVRHLKRFNRFMAMMVSYWNMNRSSISYAIF